MKPYRDLIVWQRAHALTLDVYRDTSRFPKDEMYGLTSQMRRASSSIGSNIAEGCGRGTDPEFRQFLQQAMGSATEIDYQLLLSRDLGYLSEVEYSALLSSVTEVQKMLAALIARVRATPTARTNGSPARSSAKR